MKILRLIRVDMLKALCGAGFHACVLLTALLCLTAQISFDPAAQTGCSVLQAILHLSPAEMLQSTDYCWYHAIECGTEGWLPLFLPLLAAFPFVPLSCDERESRAIRLSCIRLNRRAYSAGSLLSAMLAGGLAVMTGFLLFAAAALLIFPQASAYSAELRSSYEWCFPTIFPFFPVLGYPYLLLLRAVSCFLYGAAAAAPAFLLTGLLKNPYLTVTIPFFLRYLLTELYGKLYLKVYQDVMHPNTALETFLDVTHPNALRDLFTLGEYKWAALLYAGILMTAGGICWLVLTDRRVDYGE